jgi:hypothetical protein
MKRRVLVVKDTGSVLFHATCAEPCQPDGTRCQVNPNRPQQPGICWLASGSTRDGVAKLIERGGHYEVVG